MGFFTKLFTQCFEPNEDVKIRRTPTNRSGQSNDANRLNRTVSGRSAIIETPESGLPPGHVNKKNATASDAYRFQQSEQKRRNIERESRRMSMPGSPTGQNEELKA